MIDSATSEFISNSPLIIAAFEKSVTIKGSFLFCIASSKYCQLFKKEGYSSENNESNNSILHDEGQMLQLFIKTGESHQPYTLKNQEYDVTIWTSDQTIYFVSLSEVSNAIDPLFIPTNESKALFFENNPVAILITDKEGFPIKSNKLFKDKYSKIHPTNKSFFDDKKLIADGYSEILNNVKAGQQIEFPIIKHTIKDPITHELKNTICFKMAIYPIFEQQDKPQKFVITIEDFTEQENVKKTLKNSENWIRSITDNAFDLICIVNFAGEYIYCNQNYEHVLGYNPTELIGKKSYKYIYSDDVEFVVSSFRKLRETHQNSQITARYKTKNGSFKWMEHRGSIIFGPNNEPTNILIIASDISDRKEQEAELIASKQSYFDIYNSVSEAIFIQDVNGTFLDVNKGAELMYGYSHEELLGKNPSAVMAEGLNDMVEINKIIRQVFQTGKSRTIDFWGKRRNGEIFPKSVIINKGKYFENDVLIATARDVSKQKENEKELLAQRLRLENIIEGTEAGTWEWDINSDKIFVNDRWANMLGYSSAELSVLDINRWHQLIHPLDLVQFKRIIKSHIEGTTDYYELECRLLHKNGSWIWVLDRGKIMMRDKSNKPLKMYGTHIDITLRKNAEEALTQSEALLKTLIDNAPFEIWARDKANIGILENKKLIEHFGSILGKTPYNFNFENNDDRNKWINNNKRAFNGEIIQEKCEYTVHNQKKVFHQIIAPIYKKENIEGIAGFNIDITEQSIAENRINKLSICLLSFNSNTSNNINKLVALCGEMLNGTFAIYNQIENNTMYSLGKWNTPEDFCDNNIASVHICNEVVSENSPQIKIIQDLKNTSYFKSDPSIKKYQLHTYIGTAIFYKENAIGSLCVFYNKSYTPSSIDLEFLKLISFAITIEEERKRNIEQLKTAHNRDNAILETIPDIMFVFDKEGNIIDCNANKNSEFLISPSQFLNKNVTKILPHTLAQEIIDRINKLINGESIECHSYTLPKGEKLNYYEARYLLMGNNHVMAMVRDVTAQKEAELKLLKSEEKYRTLVENANDIIFTLSPDGIITYISPNIDSILGYTPQEIIGKSLNQIVFIEDQQKCHELLSDIEKQKIPKGSIEYRVKHKNGTWQWHTVNASTIFDSDGNFVDLMGIARDVTERKKIEQITKIQHEIAISITTINDIGDLIKNTQQLLSSIIDTSNFYIAFYNPQLDEFTAPYMQDNFGILQKWKASTSLTGRVIIEKKSVIFIDIDIKTLANEGKIELLGELAKCWIGVPMYLNDIIIGVIVTQSYTSTSAFGKEDIEILEFISNSLSIALKQKKDEKKIKLFGKAIEQSPLSIVIADTIGNLEYINPKFTSMTGYTEEEVIGKNPRILKGIHNDPAIYSELWATISAGHQWFGELENKKKNNELYWENIGISPIFDKKGVITHYVGIKEDITEKKKMIIDLMDAKNRAEESEQLKSAFLANMSHEIRTPLNGILGFASLLSEPDLELSDIKEYAQIINQSGNRLLDLINNIIDISKIESGNVNVTIENVKPYKLISDIVTSFSIISKEKSLSVFLDISPDFEDKIIRTDASKITQVISNLINNALKFTENGSIEVGFKIESDVIKYFVKDSGIGIPESHIEHIFDRFYQVDNSFSRNHEGAGLGLSICKGIAELLNGTIQIESQLNKGTIFWVNIPLIRT